MISVIMPVYNAEKYLGKSIESVLNQTYKNFELIIVNDGSTDKSTEIIEQYRRKDSRIKVVSRENKGLVISLNEAINAAKGNIIARMDADDFCNKVRLEKQKKYLLENQYDLIGSEVEFFSDRNIEDIKLKVVEESFNSKIKPNLNDYLLKKGGFICHPSIMFKKNVIKSIGGYSNKCYAAEDLELYIRCFNNNLKVGKINEKLLTYNLNVNSKSNVESNDIIKVNEIILLKINQIIESYDLDLQNIIIWGKGRGGILVEKLINKKYPMAKIEVIDKNTKNKKEILRKKIDVVFIASQLGKFEIQEEIRREYKWISEKYFSLF